MLSELLACRNSMKNHYIFEKNQVQVCKLLKGIHINDPDFLKFKIPGKEFF